MLRDHAEAASVYVVTPIGQEADPEERKQASLLSYGRAWRANEMCPRIGHCAIRVHTEDFVSESGASIVNAYAVVCDAACALLLDEPATSASGDSGQG